MAFHIYILYMNSETCFYILKYFSNMLQKRFEQNEFCLEKGISCTTSRWNFSTSSVLFSFYDNLHCWKENQNESPLQMDVTLRDLFASVNNNAKKFFLPFYAFNWSITPVYVHHYQFGMVLHSSWALWKSYEDIESISVNRHLVIFKRLI